jgi:hypothetical protein
MDDFVFIQILDEIFQMDEQTNKNVGMYILVLNISPRFEKLEKNEKKKGRSKLDPLDLSYFDPPPRHTNLYSCPNLKGLEERSSS